jgi:hypothetical protein
MIILQRGPLTIADAVAGVFNLIFFPIILFVNLTLDIIVELCI